MKILFLDFDGVLNNEFFLLAIPRRKRNDIINSVDVRNMQVLEYILNTVTDLKIVISSNRRNIYRWETLKNLFNSFGIDPARILGKTPEKLSSIKCEEIGMWLSDNPLPELRYLILDDHPIFDRQDPRKKFEYLVNSMNGLVYSDAIKIINHFEPEWKPKTVLN